MSIIIIRRDIVVFYIVFIRYSLEGKQEAQLTQRGRAMLHVIEYFAKSLKITQSHSKDTLRTLYSMVTVFLFRTASETFSVK